MRCADQTRCGRCTSRMRRRQSTSGDRQSVTGRDECAKSWYRHRNVGKFHPSSDSTYRRASASLSVRISLCLVDCQSLYPVTTSNSSSQTVTSHARPQTSILHRRHFGNDLKLFSLHIHFQQPDFVNCHKRQQAPVYKLRRAEAFKVFFHPAGAMSCTHGDKV